MHRRLRRASCLAAGWLCVVSSAWAAQLPARQAEAADGTSAAVEVVRLRAPLAGEVLAAGSTATLAWDASAGWERLPAHAEWEAFLSLDGGRTWSFRLTPHLDSDLRQVSWVVPELPSRDVRLLLRFGEERGEGEAARAAHETAIVWPERFAIRAAGPGSLPAAQLAVAGRAALQGEAALPGHAGVRAWVEGSRRGLIRRQVVASGPAFLYGPPLLPAIEPERHALAAAQVLRVPVVAPHPGSLTAHATPPPRRAARRARHPLPAADVLLQCMRLNE